MMLLNCYFERAGYTYCTVLYCIVLHKKYQTGNWHERGNFSSKTNGTWKFNSESRERKSMEGGN